MNKPKALDLFCKAGGVTKGLQRAGFEVTGIDIQPQKNYCGDNFILGDVFEWLGWPDFIKQFSLICASPPCQAYTRLNNIRGNAHKHPRLIEKVREALNQQTNIWVIENVPGAPLLNPVMLCGTMFPSLRVYRHRLFECSWGKPDAPGICNHTFAMGPSKGAYHRLDESEFITCCGHNFQAKSGRIAMQIDWMTRDEMAQAIPPAYSEFIGREAMKQLHKSV